MKNTCVIYNAGAYGTFISWLLTDFLKNPLARPFLQNGSSHRFEGINLYNQEDGKTQIQRLKDYISSDVDHNVIRIHPKCSKNDVFNITELIHCASENFKHTILLHPTPESIIWNMNNSEFKIHPTAVKARFNNVFKPKFINWGVQSSDDPQRWELREFMSLHHYPSFLGESEIDQIPRLKTLFPTVHFLPIDFLKLNFNQTITDLLDYCGVEPIDITLIDALGKDWLDLQHHKNKDQLIKKIINSIINNKFYDWSENDLTLLDEAMIQHFLRENKIELRCYNLNSLPTNTIDLEKYLDYPT